MQKKSRFLTGLLSAVMALTLFALPATAAQAPTDAVIDSGAKGSITIYKYLQTVEKKGDVGTGEQQRVDLNGGNTSALPGAGFSIYQVWETKDLLDYYNGTANKAQPKVEDFFEKEPGSTTEVKSYKAKDLLAAVQEKKVKDEKKTDDTGKVEFTGLDVGLYLVVETTPPQSVVSAVKPFLVSIPMTRVKTDPGDDDQLKQWLYDVTVYPKNTTTTAKIKLFKKGVTGNDRNGNGAIALPGVQFQLQWYNDTSEADDKWKDVGDPQTTSGEDGSITFEDLKKGTYRVKEIGYATEAVNKNYIIDTNATYEFIVDENGNIGYKGNSSGADDFVINKTENTITVYNYRPDMAKQMKDRTSDSWVAASDYNVGDEIPYKITVTIPKNIAKLNTFKVTDTPNNLQYVTGSMQIVGANNDPLTANDVYTLDTTTPTNGFTVNFVSEKLKAYAGQTIEIQYKAKLLKEAAITTDGNLNTAKLTYSNTTATDGSGENTIEDRAVVYTFMIDVVKQNDKKEKLDGVEFDLYRQVKGTKETVGAVDANKFNLAVADGCVWVKVNKTPLVTGTDGKIILTGKQADDFTNKGLANGKYALVETKTKQDYNLLKDPIYVTLNVKYTSAWNVTETFDEKGQIKKHTVENMTQTFKDEKGDTITGTVTQTVINRKGFTLPTTGGFGTLLFSGIGALLVVGGVGVLMGTKKKKDNA